MSALRQGEAIVKISFKDFFVAVLVYSLLFVGEARAQDKPQWRNLTEVSCGQIVQCLTDEEMQGLVGKTLKYRNLRFQDFGYVYLTLKSNGGLEGKNNKSSVVGTWERKNNVVNFRTDLWNDFGFVFYKIDDQLFLSSSSGGSIFPVAAVSN